MTGFYLRDSRGNTGSSCMFWAKDGNGYTSNLGKAEVYSLESAQRHFNDRYTDVPLSKDLVDVVARTRVDHQHLDESKAGLMVGCNEYVIHVRGDYDGNDVYWKTTNGSSVNLSEALVLKKAEATEAVKLFDDVIIYPMPYVVSISRHTLQVDMIVERRMITAAGIRKPKRPRQRPTTGRTRGNCPCCGRVTWGFNPYDAYTCAEAIEEKHGVAIYGSSSSCLEAAAFTRSSKESSHG